MGLKVCACDQIKGRRAHLLCVVKLFFLTKKKKKKGGLVVQWLALSPHSMKALGLNPLASWEVCLLLSLLIFVLPPTDMFLSLTDDSKSAVGVNGCLSMLATCQGCTTLSSSDSWNRIQPLTCHPELYKWMDFQIILNPMK